MTILHSWQTLIPGCVCLACDRQWKPEDPNRRPPYCPKCATQNWDDAERSARLRAKRKMGLVRK